VVVSSFDEQLDVDLLDMQSLVKYNDNVKYLLVTIDVCSRYVRVRSLKNKTAKAVAFKICVIFQIKSNIYNIWVVCFILYSY
jgi:hypothetical protein